MRDVPVEQLVAAAGAGDRAAWAELVHRYGGTVWAVARRHRLSRADAEDVSQATWLQLAVHLGELKDPAAVGGWLATTARRESLRLLHRRSREVPVDPTAPGADAADRAAATPEERLLRAEQRTAVRAAFAELSAPCRALLALLMRDPPTPYEEVSRVLGLPRGGIGPTRGRCLERLRKILER